MASASMARTRAHSCVSVILAALDAGGTTGALAFRADDSAIASAQPSHWLSWLESEPAGAGASASVRRASKRTSVGPLKPVRRGTCNILLDSKNPAVYTAGGG